MTTSLPHIIDERAGRSPSKPVFRCGNAALTYQDLATESSQLAFTLREAGVLPGDRVGIYLNKTISAPVAVYGIMKAGAAYVPIDPLSPPRRLAAVIRDAGVRHLVTQDAKKNEIEGLLKAGTPLDSLVGLTTNSLPVTNVPWDNVRLAPANWQATLKGDDLAYLMYTSGSTGEPKGIIHTHASGLSYALCAAKTYSLNSSDRLSGFPPLHFDQSTFDFFAGPSAGATTVIIPDAYMRLPASLSELMEKEKLTVWYSVPLALIRLLSHGALELRNLTNLRWVLFGGETFPTKHLRELMKILPGARFSNVYGPAEVNQVTIYNVPQPPGPDDVLPIGRVWDNAEGMVVNERNEPVAVGAQGELAVSTPAMMQGYWNRPDLSEQVLFARHSAKTGEPIVFYRTGDIVQRMHNEDLVFLGRRDRQIKVRGHRTELDALEAAIHSYHAIDSAAVYTVRLADDELQVRAAVTALPNLTINEAELRRYLSERIPRHAIPEVIEVLKELPLTATGKINHNALPDQILQ